MPLQLPMPTDNRLFFTSITDGVLVLTPVMFAVICFMYEATTSVPET